MSLQSSTPVAFLYTTDRDRSIAFYCETMGFALSSSDPFGDFIDLGPAKVRLTVIPDFKPTGHPALGWNVDDIVGHVQALKGKGVVFAIYEGMGQDELGIWTAPGGMAKVAWFHDPEGNLLSLSQA